MVKLNLSFLSLFVILLFSLFIYNGCQQQEERTYTDAELKLIMDSNTQLWNGGDIELVNTFYAEGCVRHNADVMDSNGPEGVKEFVEWVYTAYPDFKVNFNEPMKLKNRIVVHWTADGTNNGPLNENMPPTGEKVSFSGIGMSVIENGKITEEWVYYNQLVVYAQMGYELVIKAKEEEVKEKD